jgi:TetR/AcrR family transcriptional regulator, regulator of cefoperazone and chloramphenicol sensitivity
MQAVTTTAPPPRDLTAQARIRNAALDLFASNGVKATTIRDVARRAGVSPGLVQHHFKTKDGMRKAVDEFVVQDARWTITDLPEPLDERAAEFARRMGAVVRDRPSSILYLARSASDGDEVALATFKALVEFGVPQFQHMQERGQLHEDLDLEWAVLSMLLFNLGSMLFRPAIEHALGESILSEEGRQRLNRAALTLFTRGLTKSQAPPARAKRPGRRR